MPLIDKLSSIFNRRSTKELGVVLGAMDRSLNTAQEDVALLDKEYDIKTSTGEWLDEWATWFDTHRFTGESDENYSKRIIATTLKPKNTIPALEDAIRTALGDPNAKVTVYEPFTNLFKFSVSDLSGKDKIQDGVYQRHSVVDIHIDAPLPPHLVELLEDIKSAGVKVYFTRVNQIGGGTIVLMYSEEAPKYHNYTEVDLSMRRVDVFVVGVTLLGDYTNGLLSGRKLMFEEYTQYFEFEKVRVGRTATHSRTYHFHPEDDIPISLMDDYFNSVSYERERELGTAVMLEEIIVTDFTLKTTQMKAMVSPDLYANSRIPMNIFLNKSVHDMYFHRAEYTLESDLKADAFTKPFAGSIFPISMFLDVPIDSIDTTFTQSLYSSKVQSVTTPV